MLEHNYKYFLAHKQDFLKYVEESTGVPKLAPFSIGMESVADSVIIGVCSRLHQ